nr:macrophage migration inhibitory factor homolog [Onthophagus taurus]
MPHLRIETNVPQIKIPKDLPAKLCQVIAKSLGKPLGYCVVTLVGDVNMSWGGTDEPAAQATLMSIGGLGVEQNKKHSKAIFDAVIPELGITEDRMYILFSNVPSSDLGYQSTTFKDILG